MKFDFQPTKTYATEANAEKAAKKMADAIMRDGNSVRYMIVIEPNTNRYAPIFFNLSDDFLAGPIAWSGFTVVN